ncbi:MAG: hypothetical protein H0T65_04840, partial [Deltaproteobacteria bacterium]|nr:hypothetical protein [Deltaproteobacteria bacterium]
MRTSLATIVLGGAVASTMFVGASAHGETNPKDEILAPPPTYKANAVNVVENLGAKIPLDAKFKTQDGKVTT